MILKGFLGGEQVTVGSIYAPSDTSENRRIFFDEVISNLLIFG